MALLHNSIPQLPCALPLIVPTCSPQHACTPRHRNQSKLEVGSADLVNITAGTCTITVTVTNFLNATATASRVLKVVAAGVAPVISIVGPSVQDYVISEGFKVSTLLVPESVCPNSTVRRVCAGGGSPVVPKRGEGNMAGMLLVKRAQPHGMPPPCYLLATRPTPRSAHS